jgi:16S rRNA (uracil1498-N3)-methyltransferase
VPLRRIHSRLLKPGRIVLTEAEAHHARDVLRLQPGQAVELFDDDGGVGLGTIVACTAAAMVKKLSELGVACFIPLAAERSIVLPQGAGKLERWQRLAAQAAKQSRRRGVMGIEPLTQVRNLARLRGPGAWYLSTEPDAVPIAGIAREAAAGLCVLVGPEGGWTADETAFFRDAGLTAVRLTATILRVETAAVAAAAIVGVLTPGQA